MVPLLLGATFVIFAAVYALPGDPIRAIAGPTAEISPATRAALTEEYHLDESLPVQYGYYLTGVLRGDLGVDLRGRPVFELVEAAWPISLQLGVTAWALMAVVGVGLGAMAAMRRGGPVDWTVLGLTTVIVGVPYFVVAYVLQIVVGVQLGWLPSSGVRDGWPVGYLLPAVCLALFGVPELARLTRASIIENRYADFVDTAVAKGLAPRVVMVRHILRNSLVPVVSVLGLALGFLMSGAILIEGIFNVPGLGFTLFTGIRQQNGPVVVGISTLMVFIFLAVNLVVDIVCGLLDPRISLVRDR
jgi:ABC-type dipeptide/oligopeptide/nickel transport system permease component